MSSRLSLLLERLGFPRGAAVGILLGSLLIDALGGGLFASFSLLYFHEVAGLSLAAAGLALTIASLLGLPANPLCGALVDRAGARRVVLLAQILQAVSLLAYLVVASPAALLVAALPMTAGGRLFWVAYPALIADLAAPDQRDRWYALTGAARTAGL